MEFKYVIDKHEFKVICDKENILNKIELEKESFEENYFQSYYTDGSETGYLTKEEFDDNLDIMKYTLESITIDNRLIKFAEQAKKKKNGTLYNNRVVFEEGCDNTVYITEWHNTWIYNAIRVKAISDLTLSITYEKVTNTPS